MNCVGEAILPIPVSLLRPGGVYLCCLPPDAGQKYAQYAHSAGTGPYFPPLLGIYGFHALIIHALRTNGVELKNWPPLDMLWIFSATLAGSLLLSVMLQRIDTRRLVS